MRKILILINHALYSGEKTYNGIRLANRFNKAYEDVIRENKE